MYDKQTQKLRVKLASIGALAERRSCELSKKIDSLRNELSKTKELESTAIAMLNGKLPFDMTKLDLLKKEIKNV